MAVTADKRAEQRPSSEFAPARFLREVYEELRKVVWPTGPELYRYTLVVIFTVIHLDIDWQKTFEDYYSTYVSGVLLQPATAMAVEKSAAPEQEAQWYVVHAYSGHEEKVKKNLEKRIESMDMQDKILQVLVPMEDEIEIKDGKRRHVQKRIFPGYILVRMVMSNESWFVVRNTPGVTSFVGSANSPVPLQEKEVRAIQKQMKQEAPKIRVEFQVGESVRVVDGPFTDFHGKVDEINPEKGKLKVLVNMFGRETPVELDLLQVEKVH